MSLTGWFILFLIIQVIHFLGTWKLYVRANRKAWEAAVPVYNAIVLMGIINRPKWWVILLFIPIINLLMFPILWIETCRSFRYNSTKDTILAVVTLGFYIYYINYATKSNYVENRSLKPTTALGEWVSSIAFAIIAATLVHTYFIQPYTIPTSSLEKTLLVGDYLFVSKFHYGARLPMTSVAAPMVHDSIPGAGIKSYVSNSKDKNSLWNKLSFPYTRLPGFKKIKRNDIVVFSWPADSLNYMWGDESGKFTYKPIDKKTNYVKRCVGVPGDSLAVVNGYVHINGKRTELPENAKPQWYFNLYSKKGITNNDILKYTSKEFNRTYEVIFNNGLNKNDQIALLNNYGKIVKVNNDKFIFSSRSEDIHTKISQHYKINFKETSATSRFVNLTDEEAKKMAIELELDSIVKDITPSGKYDPIIFPHKNNYKWSVDNFGPIYIPKEGATVALNAETIPFYEQIIRRYEKNELTIFGDDIYINGKKENSYTFKQDYYWMMGDNRQNSLDARAWGYVPFDHVVGTPIMVWFSYDAQTGSVRWDRLFTTVTNGKTKSFFWFGIIAVGLILISVFKPKKKKLK